MTVAERALLIAVAQTMAEHWPQRIRDLLPPVEAEQNALLYEDRRFSAPLAGVKVMSTEHRKAPETVQAVNSNDLFAEGTPDGAYTAFAGMSRFHCVCPCGCGHHMNLPVYLEGQEKPAIASWEWNNSIEKPTLKPSIRDLGDCYFHGHLTDGVWTFEPDSGVKS